MGTLGIHVRFRIKGGVYFLLYSIASLNPKIAFQSHGCHVRRTSEVRRTLAVYRT